MGDLNNDGIADIAAVYNPPNNTPQIWSLLNNGKGDFTANSLTSLISSPTVDDLQAIVGVAIGKLHDNHADIVLANTVSVDNFPPAATAIILFGDGKGNFTFGKEVASPNSGGNGGAAVVGDFNRDGLNDIGILAGSDFSVILGPQLTQANAFSTTAGAAYFSGGIAVADFNGDGGPDVVTSNPYGFARLYNVPVPAVTPASLDFASSGTKTVSIRNTTRLRQSITAETHIPFRISANTCTSLAPGAACTISVEFNPESSIFPSGSLSISSNGASIAGVSLAGQN